MQCCKNICLLSMFTVTVAAQAFLIPGYARAAGDLTKQQPIELIVQLGDKRNAPKCASKELFHRDRSRYDSA